MAAPMIGAGDTLPGHPPIPLHPGTRARDGLLLGLVAWVAALAQALAVGARARPGMVVDVLGAALVVAGVAVVWGTGPALIAAGLGLLALSSFGDQTTRPRPDRP